jgi:hypothetical protein
MSKVEHQQKTETSPVGPTEEELELEHDIARLYRELAILESKKAGVQAEMTSKNKELTKQKGRLITLQKKREAKEYAQQNK